MPDMTIMYTAVTLYMCIVLCNSMASVRYGKVCYLVGAFQVYVVAVLLLCTAVTYVTATKSFFRICREKNNMYRQKDTTSHLTPCICMG